MTQPAQPRVRSAPIMLTVLGKHVVFVARETIEASLCGAPLGDESLTGGVCSRCLTVATDHDLTGLYVVGDTRACDVLREAYDRLYGPVPDPTPLAELLRDALVRARPPT